jgi:hypothetical protein
MRAAGACAGLVVALFAASVAPATAQAPASDESVESSALLRSLGDVLRTQQQLRSQRQLRQEELATDAARGREDQIRSDIREISSALAQLDAAFTQIASEVDPRSFSVEEADRPVDLSEELRDLLAPLVSELKRATQRPREIDRLRTEIADHEVRLVAIGHAIENLGRLSEAEMSPTIREALARESSAWNARLQSERTSLAVARQKLEQQIAARRSIGESLRELYQIFFKSRGRNLVIALLATLAFWLVLRRVHQELRRRGPLGRAGPSFRGRVFDLLYLIVTILGAFFVFAVVLYFFGDWVLLILFLLMLLGLVWASKQAIPKFWSQATLLLNLGPVREGERLVVAGVPYRVESLGFYSLLANPELQGALRLRLDDLFALRSRPPEEGEPWYPTRTGDWVVLADGSFGQIAFQSIEKVRLRRAGGSERVYATADFPGLVPEVLSRGFLLAVTFGVDYQHQAQVTSAVPEQLRSFVEQGLQAAGVGDLLRSMQVDFKQAGASSLDLVVLCEWTGDAAPRRFGLERLVNRLCVDACNRHGWVIPFAQLTVHAAATPEALPSPLDR